MKVDYSGMVEDLKSDLKKAIGKNNRSELKRCPFCGGEVVMFTEQLDANRDCYNFHCDGCDMSIYYDYSDKGKAIEAWNTRKPMDKVIERLEEESDFFKGEPMGSLQKAYYCMGVEKAIEIIKELM